MDQFWAYAIATAAAIGAHVTAALTRARQHRGVIGEFCLDPAITLEAVDRNVALPTEEAASIGFRIARPGEQALPARAVPTCQAQQASDH